MSPELVGALVLLVATGTRALLGRLLDKRRAQAIAAAQRVGEVYPIRPFARGTLLLVLLLYAAMLIVVLLVFMSGSEIDWTDAVVGLGAPAPFVLFALYVLVKKSGLVILTQDAVVLRRFWIERRLAYAEILDVRERNLDPFFPSLVLQGRGARLRIDRGVYDLSRLYSRILQRAPGLGDDAAVELPLRLRLRRGVVLVNVLGPVAVAAALAWLGSIIDYANNPDPVGARWVMGVVLGLVYALVLTAFVLVEIRPRQPSALDFESERIRFRCPFGAWQEWSAAELERVKLENRERPVRVVMRGVHMREGSVEYPLVLRFSGGRMIRLGERRMWQMGNSPQRLRRVLASLYDLEPRD